MKYFSLKQKWNTPLDVIILIVYFLLALFVGAFLLFFPMLPKNITAMFDTCMFHQITHLYCPGCGGTRATYALLHGHPINSFLFHPIPLYTALLGSVFFLGRFIAYVTKGKVNIMHAHIFFLWLAFFLVIGNFLFKNYILLRFGIALME